MFLNGFFWGMVVGSLVTQLIIYVAVSRHRTKVGTPSASHDMPSMPCPACGCAMREIVAYMSHQYCPSCDRVMPVTAYGS